MGGHSHANDHKGHGDSHGHGHHGPVFHRSIIHYGK